MTARCQHPRISLIAYEAWPKGKVFVRVPDEAGRYVLTDRCVVEVPCKYCEAPVGMPCRNPTNGRFWAGTHGDRRTAGNKYRRMTGTVQTHPKPLLRASDLAPIPNNEVNTSS